jgi:hypothetical protein
MGMMKHQTAADCLVGMPGRVVQIGTMHPSWTGPNLRSENDVGRKLHRLLNDNAARTVASA